MDAAQSPELDTVSASQSLARTLSVALVALGVAGWGTGIYTLVGVGRTWRGRPLSCPLRWRRDLCLCALAYAEVAA